MCVYVSIFWKDVGRILRLGEFVCFKFRGEGILRVRSLEIVVFFFFYGIMYFKIGFREVELNLNSFIGLGRLKKKKNEDYMMLERGGISKYKWF